MVWGFLGRFLCVFFFLIKEFLYFCVVILVPNNTWKMYHMLQTSLWLSLLFCGNSMTFLYVGGTACFYLAQICLSAVSCISGVFVCVMPVE